MRVVFFSSLYPTVARPRHAVFSRSTVQALRAAGLQTFVVCPVSTTPPLRVLKRPTSARGWWRELRESRINDNQAASVRWLAPPRQFFGYDAQRWFIRQRGEHLDALIDRLAPDAIISKWLPDGVAAALLGRRVGLPVVVGAIGGDIHSWPDAYRGWPRAREVIDQASAITYVSHALAVRGSELGVRAASHVIPDGVDATLFRPAGGDQHERQPLILAVGNLFPVKGHDVLIQALPQVAQVFRGVSLQIIGSGPLHSRLKRLADDLGVRERVRFLPPMSHEELAGQYREASVVAMPSRDEGLGNAALEAVASGTPVVASDVGGLPEIVGDESGVLVPPDDPEALADALVDALRRDWDPLVVRRRVIRDFSWEKTGRLYRDLLEGVVQGATA